MEEINNDFMSKTSEVTREEETIIVKQIMTAVSSPSIRGLVTFSNEEDIKRDDIVSILKESEEFVMIYFK